MRNGKQLWVLHARTRALSIWEEGATSHQSESSAYPLRNIILCVCSILLHNFSKMHFILFCFNLNVTII